MKLNFETNDGLEFELDASDDDTLQDINRQIKRSYGFPIPSQTLSFNGVIIATDNDLRACRLTDGSRLHLHVPAGTRIVRPTDPTPLGYQADVDSRSDSSSVSPLDVSSPENPTAREVAVVDGIADLDVGSSKKHPPSDDGDVKMSGDAKRMKVEVLPEQTVDEDRLKVEVLPEQTVDEDRMKVEVLPEQTVDEDRMKVEVLPEQTVDEDRMKVEVLPEQTVDRLKPEGKAGMGKMTGIKLPEKH